MPDLQTAACRDSEKKYIPSNTTRLSDLPASAGYALIAVAPWFSPLCMLEYFATARNEPVKAFIVYKPDDGTDKPPETKDTTWALDDGGNWQFANAFPTYAVPGQSGSLIVHQLSLYSGNVSTAPFGRSLEEQYESTDYIRLWAKISADSGTQLPSLWVFLVIVLGLLILIIGATSLCMHVVQRRRRNALRQRVIRGEIDLEAVGVKRLHVPEDFLRKLPVYTYTDEPGDGEKSQTQAPTHITNASSPHTDAQDQKPHTQARRSSAPDVSTATHASAIFVQPTCPICLDDFEANESQVREMPCRHIFHVDCIDPFLLNNSSLCPICKQSVLPTGYCPVKITNAMVRRERVLSHRRARGASEQTHSPGNIVARLPGAYDSIRARVNGVTNGRRIFSAPARTHARDIEMSPTSATNTTGSPDVITVPAPTLANDVEACPDGSRDDPQRRSEWARQRALTLLGNNQVPSDSEDDEQRQPRWRRGLRKIFPGFK